MLRVRDLSVAIRDTPILREVGFEIAQGEIFGLIGESGSGKSMTALALMGLLPNGSTVEGTADLDARPLLGRSEAEMCDRRGREIGMIFQEPMTALNPVQTIGDQVAETLIIHGVASRRDALAAARDRLDRVGLTADRFPLTRYPHELSGGQRQRVCIAMAVALRPKLLIADEPTTALDVTTQSQILDLLKRLVREEGMSLLLITHDLAVIAGMAARAAVMKAGEVVEAGEVETLFRARRHPYTAALFEASGHRPARDVAPPGDVLLQAEGLVREYRARRTTIFARPHKYRAVDGVSLTVRAGESVGLVGESGCGKSTLARAILGLDPRQGGTLRIAGAEIPAHAMPAPEVRAAQQVVFQDPYGSFNPRHRVARLVAEPFHLLRHPPEDQARAVDEALTAVGLSPEDKTKYIHEFSGGQRQRIAIARALIIRPKLIILDEAVSALDVRVRAQILDLLADLQRRFSLAYLFISHDLSVVRTITDRVLIMKAGQIVEDGPTERVFAAPAHPYTQALMAAVPRIPADWQEGPRDDA